MEPHCWELEAGDWFCGATKKVRRGKVRNKRAPDIMALMLSLSQAYGNWVLSSDCSGKVWFSWARWAVWAGILPIFLFMNVFSNFFRGSILLPTFWVVAALFSMLATRVSAMSKANLSSSRSSSYLTDRVWWCSSMCCSWCWLICLTHSCTIWTWRATFTTLVASSVVAGSWLIIPFPLPPPPRPERLL